MSVLRRVIRLACYAALVFGVLFFLHLNRPGSDNYTPRVNLNNPDIQSSDPNLGSNQILSLSDTENNADHKEKICTEKRKNIVFVKTHKTGTSTTVNILYQFGIVNGLNFAIYPYSHQLWMIKPHKLMELAKGESYNVMCQHMVFDKGTVESVMPSDSYYFSLLREPLKAFVSFFIFYGIDRRISGSRREATSLDDSINTFLDDNDGIGPQQYIISNNLNSMSYDLGASHGEHRGITQRDIDAYVILLDARFDLMMTLEHLDESLVLLQQDLCWENQDIFYLNRMQSRSNRSHEVLEEKTVTRLKHILTPDYAIYNHFADKLQKTLDSQGPEFYNRLIKFRESRKNFELGCLEIDVWKSGVYNSKSHPLTSHGEKSLQCKVLAERDTIITKVVSRLQDPHHESKPKTVTYGFKSELAHLDQDFPRSWKLKH